LHRLANQTKIYKEYTNPDTLSNEIHCALFVRDNQVPRGTGHAVSLAIYRFRGALLDIVPASVHIFRGGRLVGRIDTLEVTKALAALQPLYGKDNIEIVTGDGRRVRGVVRSMKTTQALTTPSVKIECANGEIIKIPFPNIAEIKDHNGSM
jgi:hypothetical protein